MEKHAAQDYTLVIMEKIATLQQCLLEEECDKNDIIRSYYDISDSVIQLEAALVDVFGISEEDIEKFEKDNFLNIS